MAIAAMITPLVLKDAIVEIEGTDYRKHVSNVTFTPSASSITWQGLSPDASFTDAASTTWTVALTYAQDWTEVQSLSRFLFENEGDRVAMTFRPKAGEGVSFSCQVSIVPGAIGGAVNAVAEATVTLGVVGRPQIVPAP